jgi:hypothetical protein
METRKTLIARSIGAGVLHDRHVSFFELQAFLPAKPACQERVHLFSDTLLVVMTIHTRSRDELLRMQRTRN